MSTDEDVKAEVPPYLNDILRLFYTEVQKGETDYMGMLTRLAVIIDSEARAKGYDEGYSDGYDAGYSASSKKR